MAISDICTTKKLFFEEPILQGDHYSRRSVIDIVAWEAYFCLSNCKDLQTCGARKSNGCGFAFHCAGQIV